MWKDSEVMVNLQLCSLFLLYCNIVSVVLTTVGFESNYTYLTNKPLNHFSGENESFGMKKIIPEKKIYSIAKNETSVAHLTTNLKLS